MYVAPYLYPHPKLKILPYFKTENDKDGWLLAE